MQKIFDLDNARRDYIKQAWGEHTLDPILNFFRQERYRNQILPPDSRPFGPLSVMGPHIQTWWEKYGPQLDTANNLKDSTEWADQRNANMIKADHRGLIHGTSQADRADWELARNGRMQDLNTLRKSQVGAGLGSLADIALWSGTAGAAHGAYQHGKKLLALHDLDKSVGGEDEDEAIEKLSGAANPALQASGAKVNTGAGQSYRGAAALAGGKTQVNPMWSLMPGELAAGQQLSTPEIRLSFAAQSQRDQDPALNHVSAYDRALYRTRVEDPSLMSSLPYGAYLPAAMLAMAVPYAAAYKGTGWLADKFRAAGIQRRKRKAVEEFQGLLNADLGKQSSLGVALETLADTYVKEAGPGYRIAAGGVMSLALLEALGGFQVGKNLATKMDPLRDRKGVLEALLQKRRAAKPMRLELQPGTSSQVLEGEPTPNSELSPGVYQTPTALGMTPSHAPIKEPDEMHDLTKLSGMSDGVDAMQGGLVPASIGSNAASFGANLCSKAHTALSDVKDRAQTGVGNFLMGSIQKTNPEAASMFTQAGRDDAARRAVHVGAGEIGNMAGKVGYGIANGISNFTKRVGTAMSDPFAQLDTIMHPDRLLGDPGTHENIVRRLTA